MWRWVLLVVAVVGLSLAAVLIGPLLSARTPESGLVFASTKPTGPMGLAVIEGDPTHDFGVMAQHTSGERVWNILNKGEGDLTLTGGHPDCACTILNLDRGESVTLKPGETYPLQVKWETKANQNAFEKKASIFVKNDPKREEIRFTIKGFVQPAVIVFPEDRTLHFAEVPSSESRKASAMLSSPDRPDFKIESVSSTRPEFLKPSFRPMSPEELGSANVKTGYRLDVDTIPTKTLGVFSADVIVKTDHAAAPEIRFIVGGKFVGPISVLPEVVRYNGTPSAEPLSATIEPLPARIPATGDTKVRQYRLTVSIPPDTPPNTFAEGILLHTDHPDVGELKIPVSITVQGGG
jgi:hypothetical protein